MQLKRNKEMEFETLKKSHKKQIIIGALAVCVIGGALTFNLTKAKYRLTQELPLAKGTINYKPYDFKIMAMYKSEDGRNYNETEVMPSSGYVINEEKSYCTTDNKTQVKGKIKTINGIHGLYNISKSDKCYLYFDKYIKTASETILTNITVKEGVPDFNQAVTTNEGVYVGVDGMYGGDSYYWRGSVNNNYVKFANFCWRIIRINGDGSIRLIYDGTTCHANGISTAESILKTSQVYNSSRDHSEYVGWTYSIGSQRTTSGISSNAKTQTDAWFTANITGTNATKVADGKYCNDRNVSSGSWSSQPSSTFNYAAYGRLITTKSPALSCATGDLYATKAGAITADEIVFAGGKWNTLNNAYYLYNGQNYWTMSPHSLTWDGYSPWACVFSMLSNGELYAPHDVTNSAFSLRPVINLKADTTFQSGGNGTINSPYIVN